VTRGAFRATRPTPRCAWLPTAAFHDRLLSNTAEPTPRSSTTSSISSEATLVAEALAMTNGNQVKASEILGVNRATLRKKMT